MQSRNLTQFSLARPRLVFTLVLLITLAFLAQLPKIQTDTNPKNMLPPTSEVRVWNDSVDRTFALYEDTIVVGIVHPAGALNTGTLEKVRDITAAILGIKGVTGRDLSSVTTIDNVTAVGADLKLEHSGR